MFCLPKTAWPPDFAPAFTDKLHQKQGNVGLSDGSVQQLTSTRLRDQFRNSDDTTTTPCCRPSQRSGAWCEPEGKAAKSTPVVQGNSPWRVVSAGIR